MRSNLCGLLSVNPPIGQALAGNAFQGNIRALHIVEPQRRAGVVAEIKPIAIALQMLLSNVVERTHQATFEDAEKPSRRFVEALPRAYSLAECFTTSWLAYSRPMDL